MHSPREEHSKEVYKVLHYLKTTLRKRISFKNNEELNLEAYIDTN